MTLRAAVLGVFLLAAALLGVPPVVAQPPHMNYQGELKERGARLSGSAKMKFAIVKGCPDACVTLWSNDSTSVAGSEPTVSLEVAVSNGVFSVDLGAAPMTPLTSAALADAVGAALRVWVKTTGAFEQLSDQRLASVPFALHSPGGGASWAHNGSDVFRLTGRVGIGTDTPAAPLDIRASESTLARLQTTNTQATLLLDGASQSLIQGGIETSDRLVLRTNSSSTTGPQITMFGSTWADANAGAVIIAAGGDTDGDIRLATRGSTRLRVEGTTGNLDVLGGAAFQGNHLYLRNRSAPGGRQTWGFVVSTATGILNLGPVTDVPPATGNLEASVVKILPTAPANSLIIDDAGNTVVKVLEITGGSDLAEPFEIREELEGSVRPGMVVSIDPAEPGKLRLADEPYDRRVAGVISGANGLAPGMVMRTPDHSAVHDAQNVALSGRVHVQATTANGPIQPGDLLTTSARPGFAMKATNLPRARGAAIGKAMSALTSGTGYVLLLVQPQ